MNVAELVSDKSWTRKKLAEMAIGESAKYSGLLQRHSDAAKKLSNAIDDDDPNRVGYGTRLPLRYDFDEATERACVLLAERPNNQLQINDLMSEIDSRKSEAECLREEIAKLTAERDTAQEAAATVGAAFNDFRRQGLRMGNPADAAECILRDGNDQEMMRWQLNNR